ERASAKLAAPPAVRISVAREPAEGEHGNHTDHGDDDEDGEHSETYLGVDVGAPGFEPGISCSQSMRVSQATLRPACWILQLISRPPATHQRAAGCRIAGSRVLKVR